MGKFSEDYFAFTGKIFDRSKTSEKPEVLKGVRVLDLARVIYGPVVSKWLGLFGAEVIKVEEPEEGDQWRTGTYWAKYWKDSCPYFQSLNPNKCFIGIDLKKPRGKELVLELAKISDVVVESFRAGLVEAWGIGYTVISQVNPKVIYISCSGYGQWGPLRFFPSWDLIAQSMSGVARLTGFPGKETYKLQDYYGDFFPGLLGAMGVMAALNYRERTGKGQYIDMAQAEALMRTMLNWTYMSVVGEDLERTGNVDPSMVPSGIFKTADGRFVAIAIATDNQLSALLKAMGRTELAEDKRFRETFERLKAGNAEELDKVVEEWVFTKTEAELIELAKRHGFPAAPVMDDWRLVNDNWRRERGSVTEFEDEMYGKGIWVASPVALEKTPGRVKRLTKPIGYHNRYILKRLLGLSEKEIKELEKEGVIGYWSNRVGQRPPPYYDIENDPIFNYRDGEKK
jgi:crotonobetainyl-CoA:carnitine CoA-transferase CaiB-like acyl-CoA transferase